MATSRALLAECACINYGGEWQGGWEIRRLGKEAPKALDASLGECTPKVYRELPLQYKTANINVKNFRVYIQV